MPKEHLTLKVNSFPTCALLKQSLAIVRLLTHITQPFIVSSTLVDAYRLDSSTLYITFTLNSMGTYYSSTGILSTMLLMSRLVFEIKVLHARKSAQVIFLRAIY